MFDVPPEPAPSATILVASHAITTEAGAEAFGTLHLDANAFQTASGRAEEALRQIGGVQLFRASSTRSANPTAEGLTARGLSGNGASRLEVTLDNVPLSDPFFGFVAWGNLIGQPLGGADLRRGAGVGGPGALAGSLDLRSGAAGNQAMLRYGSRNSLEGTASLALPVGRDSFALTGGYARGDGQYLVAEPGAADVQARYEQWSVAASTQMVVGSIALESRASMFADDRLRGVEGADIGASGGDLSVQARLEGEWRGRALVYGKFRDFNTTNRSLNADRTVATTNLEQVKTPASGWGAEVAVSPPLAQGLALDLGAAYRANTGTTKELFRYTNGVAGAAREAGGAQSIAGLFADSSAQISPELLLTAAGRVDFWRISQGHLLEYDLANGLPGLQEQYALRTGQEYSGRLGAVWRPLPALKLRAAGYRGWRLPTLNELYRPFRAGADATAANPMLAPERLWGAEAGIGFQPLGAIEISGTAYWNRLENPVTNVTIASGPGNFPGVGFVSATGRYRQRQNLESIESKGLEADLRLPLGRFSLSASLAYVDARMQGGGLDGLRPSQAPEWSGGMSVGWSHKGYQAHVSYRHLGSRFEDDLNQRVLGAADTIDVRLVAPLSRDLQLELAGENLTDADIASGYSGTQVERGQPRTLWLGLRFKH